MIIIGKIMEITDRAIAKLEQLWSELPEDTEEVEAALTDRDIDDIVCVALEGGITYWCDEAVVIENEYYGEYASDQISRNGSLRLHDAEEDEYLILTRDKLLKGFALACKSGYGEDWFDAECCVETGHIDAVASDIIIQLAIFGEVKYG